MEAQVLADVLNYLATRRDVRVWRVNVGAVKWSNRVVRFNHPGMADVSGIVRGGRRLEIETKDARGRQTPEQRAFQKMIEDFGGVYILARSVSDVVTALSPGVFNGPL